MTDDQYLDEIFSEDTLTEHAKAYYNMVRDLNKQGLDEYKLKGADLYLTFQRYLNEVRGDGV